MFTANSNRYEVFLKVAELGNITRSAEALNYTQSGVSHAIAALEKEAGFTLFMRSSSGVTLTANGRKILEPIQKLVNEQRNLTQTIANINHVMEGTIRIGTFSSVFAQWLPGLIRNFQSLYPHVDFELLDGNYDDVASWIMQERVDCGFLTAPAPAGFFFHPLTEDPLLVLLCADHPLSCKKALKLEELAKEPFIMWAQGGDKDIRSVLGPILQSIKVKYTLNSDISVMAMVEKGLGISILPELILRHYTFHLNLMSLDPPAYRTIGIASKAVNTVSIVTKTFLDYLIHSDIRSFES